MKEGTGLVTCLYRNTRIDNLFAALETLSVQTDFLPNVLFDLRWEGLSYAFGSTICINKRILSRIGGLESLLDYLADDYQIGNRVDGAGYCVTLSPRLIDHVSSTVNSRQFFRHRLRTAITHRVCRPAGYFGSVVTHGISLAFLLWLMKGFTPPAGGLLLFVCGLRIFSGAYLNRTVIRNKEVNAYLWLIPFNDILNTIFWFLSFFVNTVHWKHRRFRILKGGRMVELGRWNAT
jgi:ceramide glucosyltransferase